jgi:hypothetical protein
MHALGATHVYRHTLTNIITDETYISRTIHKVIQTQDAL